MFVFLFPLKFWSFVSFQREEKFLISNSRAHSHRERETHTERERERERERETRRDGKISLERFSSRTALFFYFSVALEAKREGERERSPLSPGKTERESRHVCIIIERANLI